MASESTLFKNKQVPFQPNYMNGYHTLTSTVAQGYGNGNFTLREGCFFSVCTGNTSVPDVTPGQSSNVVLIPDSVVPYGTRCYLTSVTIDVQGAVNWGVTSPTAGTVPYLALQDSVGVPAVSCPFNALKGMADYALPSADISIPLLFGPNTVNGPVGTPPVTFTYVQSTGVITLSAGIIGYPGVGSPIRVVDGTGKGQAAFVTAIAGSTITVAPPFTGLDGTSVIGMDYQALTSVASTTVFTLPVTGTPYTANAFDNGYNVIGISGPGSGTARPIASNTTGGVVTLAYAVNTSFVNGGSTGGSVIQITNENNLNGIVDTCVGDKWGTLTLNKGLQVAVNLFSGTSPVGSAVRIYCEGFFAA